MPQPPVAPICEIAAVAGTGGRAAAVAPGLEAALTQALLDARPRDHAQLAALNIEVTATVTAGAALRARAWVERATRTLAFVSGEVLGADGARVASGAGVFELQAKV